MVVAPIFASLLGWLFRAVVVKFVVLSVCVAVFALFVPWAVEQLAPFLGVQSLTDMFASFPPGLWWFLDGARLDVGLPLVFAAWVTRFLIRRLPVIG